MIRNPRIGFAALLLLLLFAPGAAAAPAATAQKTAPDPPAIVWHTWGDALFDRARREGRHVLLDLNAKWCHWCHFMERRTYAHEDVRRLVDQGYLAVKVDQDANPDLAVRYGDWGWPATIIFDPDGREVTKLRGFQRPSLMTNILFTVLRHPERVPELAPERGIERSVTAFLTREQRAQILRTADQTYDREHAGWGRGLKFLRPDVVTYALREARRGDTVMRDRVRATLDAALALLDPEWGGIYQYSHKRDWSAPHYEKIMASQAVNLRLYALAYRQFGDPAYLEAAQGLYRYLVTHLRDPEGAFYASQDADVDAQTLGRDFYRLSAEQRAAQPKAPPVDKSLYARENGWAISALLALYDVTGEADTLNRAVGAAEWVLRNRALPGGGFAHGPADERGPFLSDNLAMGQALLELYMASGDQRWLRHSADTAAFIDGTFRHATAGLVTARTQAARAAAFDTPFLSIEENIGVARYANLMHRVLGDKRFRTLAEHAMRYLTSESVTGEQRFLVGIVLADEELALEPAQITIIGADADERTKALHRAALKLPFSYRRVDRWDPAGAPLPNPDVTYPKLEKAAAFACANQICSLPVFEPENLAPVVDRMLSQRIATRPQN